MILVCFFPKENEPSSFCPQTVHLRELRLLHVEVNLFQVRSELLPLPQQQQETHFFIDIRTHSSTLTTPETELLKSGLHRQLLSFGTQWRGLSKMFAGVEPSYRLLCSELNNLQYKNPCWKGSTKCDNCSSYCLRIQRASSNFSH